MDKILLIVALLLTIISCGSRNLYPEKTHGNLNNITSEIEYDDEYQLILQLVIDDIFNPNGRQYLDPLNGYGGDNCKTIVLIDRGGGYTLNNKFQFTVKSCEVLYLPRSASNLDIPAVGIDFRRLEMIEGVGHVTLCVFSFGTKRIIGGCVYRYEIHEINGHWVVKLIDAFDP